MKKFLFLALASALFAVSASAQRSTRPRWGGGMNDNTGRVMTQQFDSLNIDVNHDTVYYTPINYVNVVYVNLATSDSARIVVKPRYATTSGGYQGYPVGSYIGDKMEIIVNGASGNYINLFPGAYSAVNYAGKVTLSTKGVAVLTLEYDGTHWNEASRIVQ